MAPVQQPQTTPDAPQSGKSRTGLIVGGLAATVGIVGIGALVLSSGPDTPAQDRAPIVSVNPLAANAPVQQLGDAAPEGSWQRGLVTLISFTNPVEYPPLRIEAADIETGRYTYPGELTIAGDLTTPGVEITAGALTVDGSITADHVTLGTDFAEPEQRDHQVMIISGLDHREFLVAFEQYYARGDLSVAGGVSGENIALSGGQVEIGGDVSGGVTITGATGEVARASMKHEYYDVYRFPGDWRDGVPTEAFTEKERTLAPAGDQPQVRIAGQVGPTVVLEERAAVPEVAAVLDRPVPGNRP